LLLLEVIPMSLGIAAPDSTAEFIFERNFTIPARKSIVITTAMDNQTRLEIKLCQGERVMFADNTYLGCFSIDGILPAPQGIPQFEFRFDIGLDGLLQVSAKDKTSGKEQKVSRRR
jgi:molecular chaperone DnaK